MINLPFFKKEKGKKIELETGESFYISDIKDIFAPQSIRQEVSYLQINDTYIKTIMIANYSRYIYAGWVTKVINTESPVTFTIHIKPIDTSEFLKDLQKKVARLEAEIMEREEKGMVRSPEIEIAYQDIEELRDLLTQGQEKVFDVSVYISILDTNLEELVKTENEIIKILESILILPKKISFQQLQAYQTTLPLNKDRLDIKIELNTTPLSMFIPFITSDLTENKGIFYGINQLTRGLVIFDRFSLENAHMTVFARSGAGKSYAIKLEIIRSLMLGTDVIVVDPENEYKRLCDHLGGTFIPISLGSDFHINPFDLPPPKEGETFLDVLKEKASFLLGLFKLILGEITPDELAILDQAITATYASFNITQDTKYEDIKFFPTLNDFEIVLRSIEGGERIADKFYPYTKGNLSGFINQPTNIKMENNFIVFGIRDLQETLRPIAMYIIINFIIAQIVKNIKKRILVIDEAWWLVKTEEGGSFLLDVVKRGRKWYLGVTTITQDVEDFLKSPYGRPIITNSALSLLLKQSPVAAPLLKDVFKLTDAEKDILVNARVGEGIFFAGLKHVPIKIVASYTEDKIITTSPEQLLAIKREEELKKKKNETN
jgi:conjugal transfer ATP-binding protein TraC